jgi:hypothetical protein
VTRSEQARQLLRAKIPAEVLRRRDEIRELAVKALGSSRDEEHWFERPIKFALEAEGRQSYFRRLEVVTK